MLNIRKVGMALVGAVFVTACQDSGTTPTDAPVVMAAVTIDGTTGAGFVGKGDVQYTYGWNNKQLQDNAAFVRFRLSTTVITEVSWSCTNSNNENVQVRERTTTTSLQGLLTSVARERNQITGFNVTGFNGTPTSSSTIDGPPLNSCPSGPWTLTTPAGDPVVVGGGGSGVEVSKDSGANWTALLSPPVIVP